MLLAACSMSGKLEQNCRREARVIIQDPGLWSEYRTSAEQTYQSRAQAFPDTGRAVVEYAPGFEERFGPHLTELPNSVEGKVVRDDVYIVKNARVVAQFVDFVSRQRTIETVVDSRCIGLFPKLYSRWVPVT